MPRQIITTKDGSHTIAIPELAVAYHSHNGAVQESIHVFIEAGLRWWIQNRAAAASDRPIRIFEMGFGTGLNALLTVQEAAASRFLVYYTAVEKHPLPPEEAAQLNYAADEATGLFQNLHASLWNLDLPIHPFFTLHKIAGSLQALPPLEPFDIVYYDAFAPAAQPELWTEATFLLVYHLLRPGGILVTYCSKSIVRRAMEAAGLVVIKIPGPFGKREMVRAMRPPEG